MMVTTRKICIFLLLIASQFLLIVLYFRWDLAEVIAKSEINLNKSVYFEKNIKVKIITQNLWCHYLVTVGPNSYERIKAFVSQVKDYDVILLQEVFVLRIGPLLFRGWASFIVAEFAKYGFVYHTSFLQSVPYLFGQNNGVAIFTKIPIIETGTVTFEKSIFDLNLDYLNNKGFVWAKVMQSKKTTLTFISTHMTAMLKGVDSELTGNLIRTREINSITSFINKHKEDNFVLVGDFNTRKKENYIQLKTSLPTLTDIVSQEKLITYDADHENETLDLIFLSKSLKYSLPKTAKLFTEKKQVISDHFAVTTEVESNDN